MMKLNLTGKGTNELGRESLKNEHVQEQEKQQGESNIFKHMPNCERMAMLVGMTLPEKISAAWLDELCKRVMEKAQEICEDYKKQCAQEMAKIVVKAQKQGVNLLDEQRQRRKAGRKPAKVDWGQYECLKAGGASEKQAAEILGVGVSTLRRLKAKEKNKKQ